MAKKVLYVEDDKFFSDVLAKALEQEEGIEVKLVKNGEEALTTIPQFQPDIILLDLLLPKMDGFQVLEKVKGSSDTEAIPVVILSNLGSDEDVERGKQLGATKYFVKAYTVPKQIVSEVKRILGGTQ